MLVKKITLLGHKDHGKSTLIGNMLILTDRVNPAKLKEAQRLSKSLGKRFEPGFILDSFQEEREGGLTIDTVRTEKIPVKDLAFEFIDVPGHEELIKNMITGASYADVALLIVSAKRDEGVRDQTKRHIFIATKMLDVKKFVVAVNKMDLVGYKEKRFDAIKKELSDFIEGTGVSKEKISFVPVAAYLKENLTTKSKNMPWYKGKALLDVLYLNALAKDPESGKDLRVVLQGFVDPEKRFIGGKIVSGNLSVGQKVRLLPSGFESNVKEVIVKNKKVKKAETGKSVAFSLKSPVKTEARGSVLVDTVNPPKVTSTVKALIFVVHPSKKNMKIKFNDIEIGCKSIKVLRKINVTTGEGLIQRNEKLENLNVVEAQIELDRKLPFESYDKTHELGRFIMYSNNKFSGIGIVE